MKILLFLLMTYTLYSQSELTPSLITDVSYKYFGHDNSNNLALNLQLGFITDNKHWINRNIILLMNSFVSGIGVQLNKYNNFKPKFCVNSDYNFFPLFNNSNNQISGKFLNYDETNYYNREMEWFKFGFGWGVWLFGLNGNTGFISVQPRIGLTTLSTNIITQNDPGNIYEKTFFGFDYGARLSIVTSVQEYLQSIVWVNYRNIFPSPDFHEIDISGEINYIFDKGKFFYSNTGPLHIDPPLMYHYGPEAKIYLRFSYLNCFLNSKLYNNYKFQLGFSYRLIDIAQPPEKTSEDEF